MQVANQESSTLTKLFPILDNKGVNIKKEIMAGLTTFLTMAYIIAVNPNILSQSGMPAGALVTGTCLAAAVGCFIMGIIFIWWKRKGKKKDTFFMGKCSHTYRSIPRIF